VAQRRRRVFVVGYLGDWRRAAAVLFERESLRGNPAPSREAGEKPAPTVTAGPPFSRTGNDRVECDAYIPQVMATINATDAEKWGSNQWVNEGKAILHPIALAENTIGRKPMNGGNGDGFTDGGPMYTLNATGVHGVASFPANANADSVAVAYSLRDDVTPKVCLELSGTLGARDFKGAQTVAYKATSESKLSDITMSLTASYGTGGMDLAAKPMVCGMQVRRLTPIECERLQGFPDGYTNIKDKCPDGPRYKALGNSMAVPVMKWIGERIQMVENYE